MAIAAILHYFVKPLVKKFPAWVREKYGIQKEKGVFELPNVLFLLALLVFIVLPITIAVSIYFIVTNN